MAVKQHSSTARRAPISVLLDTSLTGAQCLAWIQPTTAKLVLSLPFITTKFPHPTVFKYSSALH